jgi:Short C-terminal domain
MRTLWKGAISFGSVTIPVSLYPATCREEPKFRMQESIQQSQGKAKAEKPITKARANYKPAADKTTRVTLTFRKASGSPFCTTGKSRCTIPWITTLGGAATAGGYSGSLSFSSQHGTFSVDTLPLVSPGSDRTVGKPSPPSYEAPEPPPAPIATSRQGSVGSQSHDDILKALERLSDLHQKGILSEDEFKSKKAELLSRL